MSDPGASVVVDGGDVGNEIFIRGSECPNALSEVTISVQLLVRCGPRDHVHTKT
jgi:hypothetical protein